MTNGYGQIFLLLSAIGLILLGASGKARELWDVLKGSGGSNPSTPNGGANTSSTSGSQVPKLTNQATSGSPVDASTQSPFTNRGGLYG